MNTIGKSKRVSVAEALLESLPVMDQDYFPRPWTQRQWEELPEAHHQIYLWIRNSRNLGFALFGHVAGGSTAHLLKLCLKPEFRGQGEAQIFWKELMEEFKTQGVAEIFLEVEESNHNAQNFYRKSGFNLIRIIKGFYSDGENGHMMLLTL